MIKSLRIICLLLFLCALPLVASAVPNPVSGKEIDRATWVPSIEPIKINDYLLAFYEGREIANDPPFGKSYANWIYWGAMEPGIASYVIHQGDTALVYDTMPVKEQAEWILDYLKKMGIKKFTVILSHSHNDHVGGNEVFKNAGADIIASQKTLDILTEAKDSIEGGYYRNVPDAPAIKPLIMPNILFEDKLVLYVGDIRVDALRYNIHSPDTTVLYLPKDKLLLSGDAIEDPVPYINNPGDSAEHVVGLKKLMKDLDFKTIYPNHGAPEKIKNGGFSRELPNVTIRYLAKLVKHCQDKDFLTKYSNLKEFIKDDLAKGEIVYFEPYEPLHLYNMKKVQEFFKDKKLPVF